jgi:hypothetical protein
VLVVAINEERTIVTDEEIIEFTLSLADAFEGTEALQVGTTYIGNETTGRLGSLYQRLDVARV